MLVVSKLLILPLYALIVPLEQCVVQGQHLHGLQLSLRKVGGLLALLCFLNKGIYYLEIVQVSFNLFFLGVVGACDLSAKAQSVLWY